MTRTDAAAVLIRLAVAGCALAIAFGPWYTDPGYDWTRHSVSELAGQHTSNAWIMRAGLAALGGAAILGFFSNRARFNPVFLLFGLSIALTAVFPHRPFAPDLGYSARLDDLHSAFASLGGFAAVVAFSWTAWSPGPVRIRAVAGTLAILYALLSAAMFRWPGYQGVFQRIIFGSFILWTFSVASPPKDDS